MLEDATYCGSYGAPVEERASVEKAKKIFSDDRGANNVNIVKSSTRTIASSSTYNGESGRRISRHGAIGAVTGTIALGVGLIRLCTVLSNTTHKNSVASYGCPMVSDWSRVGMTRLCRSGNLYK